MGFGPEWRASNEYEPNHEAVFSVGSCFGEFNYCNCIITCEPLLRLDNCGQLILT